MGFFPEVPKVRYEGPTSTNALAFRHYNPEEVVAGKSMREHFRFAVAYWHTMRGTGSDPFGPGCAVRPWEDGTDSVEMHADALGKGETVVIVDDVIATGGTAAAAGQLVESVGGTVAAFAFVVELAFLNGREKLGGRVCRSLIVY